MTKELHRLHDIGIIHGDVNAGNVMINVESNQFKIRWIDFGNAYDMGDLQECAEMSAEERLWLPPELCQASAKKLQPHPSQDIYSFGCLLEAILDKHPSYPDLKKAFPSIHAFKGTAKNLNPTDRPTLEAFIQNLAEELNPKPTLEASALKCG